ICYITQKEDGTSYTAYHTIFINMEIPEQEQYVGVCSRNLELKNGAFPGSDVNIYWKITKLYDIEEKLKQFYQDTGRNIAIQGEICGDGIAKNPLGLPRNTQQLHLFQIYDIDNQKYLDYEEFILVSSELALPMVETIYFGRFNFTLEELLKMSEGKYPNTKNEREGIVIRPDFETFSETLQGRMSFKVINNLYLLKES
ncbi:MAG: RNA ligase family protein, partial [Candidatus Subteraquimicrobiales bacterium]|nr:RNA ligase family protein [Candidatus Subteraquimicrobiales bacterium]